MNTLKQKRLEEAGYTVGDVRDLLELSPEEEAMIDTGLLLSQLVRETRVARGWSTEQLGRKIGVSAERVEELEAAAGTRFELLFQSLYAMNVSPRTIATALSQVQLETSPLA